MQKPTPMMIKQSFIDFFSNHFMIRLPMWILGNVLFLFGIAFIISANSGVSTYDAFFQPLRVLCNIKPEAYGTTLLMPIGFAICLITLIMHYWRQKTIRIDYLLGILYVVTIAFILDAILEIGFIHKMLIKTDQANWSFVEHPAALGMLLSGIPLFTVGIGILTACSIMPNCYAVLVEEIALVTKRTFKFIQTTFDIVLVCGGLLMTIINIYGTKKINLTQASHFIGLGTLIILLVQSHIIHYALTTTRQLLATINKKEKQTYDTTH